MKDKVVKTERLRKFINLQYVKIKRTAAVGSLIMLILNLSFVMYPFIEYRGIHPYVAIPLVFFFVLFVVWLAAHIWVKKLEMYRSEKLSEMLLNPYAVYAIAPFEEMKYRNMELPIMRSLCCLLPNGKNKKELCGKIDLIEGWCDLGFIPKKDFVEHLRRYYITDIESRL